MSTLLSIAILMLAVFAGHQTSATNVSTTPFGLQFSSCGLLSVDLQAADVHGRSVFSPVGSSASDYWNPFAWQGAYNAEYDFGSPSFNYAWMGSGYINSSYVYDDKTIIGYEWKNATGNRSRVSTEDFYRFDHVGNSLIVAVGGSNSTHDFNDVVLTASDKRKYISKYGSSIPGGLWASSASTIANANKIYVAGGRTQNKTSGKQDAYTYTNRFFSYDVAKNQWTKLAPLPFAMFDNVLVASSDGKKIYSLGGSNGDRYFPFTQVYNVNGDNWAKVANTPKKQEEPGSSCAVVIRNSIYYIVHRSLYRSNDGGASWKELSTRPMFVPPHLYNTTSSNMLDGSCVAMGEEGVLVIGGAHSSGSNLDLNNRVEVYNITTGQWSFAAPMKYARSGLSTIAIPNSDKILACGGHKINSYKTVCEQYTYQDGEWLVAYFKLHRPLSNFGLFVANKTSGFLDL